MVEDPGLVGAAGRGRAQMPQDQHGLAGRRHDQRPLRRGCLPGLERRRQDDAYGRDGCGREQLAAIAAVQRDHGRADVEHPQAKLGRRPRQLAGEGERGGDEAKRLEAVLAGRAGGEMPLELVRLVGVERIEGERRYLVVDH